MFYVVRFPADRLDNLDWYYVVPTKKEALGIAENLLNTMIPDMTRDHKQWKIKYIPKGSKKFYAHYIDTQTIVVEQLDRLYHGA